MIYMAFIGIIVVSLIITAIVMILFMKTLSVVTRILFPDIGDNRANTRQCSRIEVCCIYCFDKSYDFFYSHIFARIGRVIKYIIGKKPVRENGNNSYGKSNTEYGKTHLKGSIPENHKSIIGRKSTKCK